MVLKWQVLIFLLGLAMWHCDIFLVMLGQLGQLWVVNKGGGSGGSGGHW
jgi:hypothetical protein